MTRGTPILGNLQMADPKWHPGGHGPWGYPEKSLVGLGFFPSRNGSSLDFFFSRKWRLMIEGWSLFLDGIHDDGIHDG